MAAAADTGSGGRGPCELPFKSAARQAKTYMRNPSLSRLARYAFAVAATAVAVLLRWALEPWLVNDVPFITLFAAIVVTAWYGGPGPAILTAAAGF
ncbi:MAG TPA: DUF4118 domain-containing protein, partial [Burkholderiaceae bacterium]|nr:DUF4118 domain-containing protein [Burkholderiaceae bacterium]